MKKKLILAVSVFCMIYSIGIAGCAYGGESELAYSYSVSSSESITLNGNTAETESQNVSVDNSTVTIKSAGTYKISGKLTDGQIVVDAGDNDTVTLILDGVDIASSDAAPIYSENSGVTVIYLEKNSKNVLTDTSESREDADAALYVQDNLVIGGSGTLTVNSDNNDAIKAKDQLVIESGTLSVESGQEGIQGKDSVTIKDGSITISCTGDGIKSNNDKDSAKGWVKVSGGKISITSQEDGIQAETDLNISGGNITIKSGGGSANSTKQHNEMPPDNGNGRMNPPNSGEAPNGEMTPPNGDEAPNGEMTPPNGDEAPNGEMTPPNGEAPNGEMTPPNGGEAQNGDDSSERPEPPSMPDNDGIEPEDDTEDEDSVSTKGIKAGGMLNISGGTLNIDSADDSVHAGGKISISGGEITASSGDDGVHSDTELSITGGTVNITESYEGLEGTEINISDGSIDVKASDDGINVNDSEGTLSISGGTVFVDADGDGIDSNGNITVSGGATVVEGPVNDGNGALDYDKTAEISGGTLIATGSSGMAQAVTAQSGKSTLSLYFTETQKADTLVSITDSSGKLVCAVKPSKDFKHIVVASDSIVRGKTYTVSVGGTIDSERSDGYYSSGSVSDAEKLCTFTPNDTVTSISDTGEERQAGNGFGGKNDHDRGMNRENQIENQSEAETAAE